MSAYQPGQEFNNERWGTGMPIMVMVGSNVIQVRARGSFSAAVDDPAQLAAQAPDPDDLPAYMRSLVVSAATDFIGERSQAVATAAQLTAVSAQVAQALQAAVEARFKAAGLRLKSFSLEAIESL